MLLYIYIFICFVVAGLRRQCWNCFALLAYLAKTQINTFIWCCFALQRHLCISIHSSSSY